MHTHDTFFFSLMPQLVEFLGLHVNIAKNTSERSRLQILIPVHGHDRLQCVYLSHDMMAADDTAQDEALSLKKTNHFLPRDPLHFTHVSQGR